MHRFIVFLNLCMLYAHAIEPGPEVRATKGEVWPKPQRQDKSEDYYVLQPLQFNFELLHDVGCPNFLNDAITRYWTIITTSIALKRKNGMWQKIVPSGSKLKINGTFFGNLESLVIDLAGECTGEDILPSLGDSENYSLSVDVDGGYLYAPTIWGILRGLETFSQLIYLEGDSLIIKATFIEDFPRFSHRGLMIDTSRHFQPISIILQMLDAMAYNKLNVLHWHITDDHSFPYQSTTYPELSEKGAYHPEGVYTQKQISNVVEAARLRGIRVVPEFDTPGHTRSWGVSHPELLTTCYTNGDPNGELGPMDPSKNNTYDFIDGLFAEVLKIFPDEYFHIGGDEVDSGCWESNPDISQFMEENGISSYTDLETYFIQNVVNLLEKLETKYLVWEEVFVEGVDIPDSTVVQVWKEEDGLNTLKEVVAAGKYGLYSACWYFASLWFAKDWNSFYSCEPLELIQDEDQKKLVLGGEACMWGEYVNEFNIIPETWPAGSAVAERLWSSEDVTDVEEARKRMEEHSCRMNKRGIAAQPPNGPGFCF